MVAAFLLPIMSGCAIKTPHLSVSQWPLQSRASYYSEALPYRLLVVPTTDQRPEHERQGQQPSAQFFVLWNKRVGDYYTGDTVFGNHVGDQLSAQLADYVQASHTFTATTFTGSTPPNFNPLNTSEIQTLAAQHSADFVLTSELQHFFGSQHQHFSLYALPLYFINMSGWQDNKSLPWGQTTLRVVLYDGRTGDLVWQEQFTAQETLPRDTDSMAEAAMVSFATMSNQLVSQMRNLPLQSFQPTSE